MVREEAPQGRGQKKENFRVSPVRGEPPQGRGQEKENFRVSPVREEAPKGRGQEKEKFRVSPVREEAPQGRGETPQGLILLYAAGGRLVRTSAACGRCAAGGSAGKNTAPS